MGAACASPRRKLAGKLCFAQTAATGRSGEAALKPIYDLIASGGGQFSREVENSSRCWESVPQTLNPGLILDSKIAGKRNPVRIYSDASGAGGLETLTFTSSDERPLPLLQQGEAEAELHTLATSANEIYIFEPVAEVRRGPSGREIILFAGNEAACGALTKGAAKNGLALTRPCARSRLNSI